MYAKTKQKQKTNKHAFRSPQSTGGLSCVSLRGLAQRDGSCYLPPQPQHIATTSLRGWTISFVFVLEFCWITLLWASCVGDDAAAAIAATVLESEVSLECTWKLFIPAFSRWTLRDLFLLDESLQGCRIPMVSDNELFIFILYTNLVLHFITHYTRKRINCAEIRSTNLPRFLHVGKSRRENGQRGIPVNIFCGLSDRTELRERL